jgi:hypothetical protein
LKSLQALGLSLLFGQRYDFQENNDFSETYIGVCIYKKARIFASLAPDQDFRRLFLKGKSGAIKIISKMFVFWYTCIASE